MVRTKTLIASGMAVVLASLLAASASAQGGSGSLPSGPPANPLPSTTFTPIGGTPEPTLLLLAGVAGAGFVALRKRKAKKQLNA